MDLFFFFLPVLLVVGEYLHTNRSRAALPDTCCA